MTTFTPDIGNHHVIDYYLWRELPICAAIARSGYGWRELARISDIDFDITTERCEGWAYDNSL